MTERVPRNLQRAAMTEWNRLTSALNAWGVIHVEPLRRNPRARAMRPGDLFAALVQSSDPRLRQAAILFLVTHPETAAPVREAVARLPAPFTFRGQAAYVAAAAFQRMARTRIRERLGDQPLIPAAYLAELGLPSLEEAFGKETLLALADLEEARFGYPAWRTHRMLLELFLYEFKRTGWGQRVTTG